MLFGETDGWWTFDINPGTRFPPEIHKRNSILGRATDRGSERETVGASTKNVCIVSDFSGRIRRSLKSESRHGRDRFEIHGQDIHGQYLKHGLVYFTSRLNQILVYKYYEVSFYALKERHTL